MKIQVICFRSLFDNTIVGTREISGSTRESLDCLWGDREETLEPIVITNLTGGPIEVITYLTQKYRQGVSVPRRQQSFRSQPGSHSLTSVSQGLIVT